MSYFKNRLFSDTAKDVIGNDPVLDQFDTFYAASFYGTMSDDYVTGTIVNVSTNFNIVTTGSRGRAFSSFYSRDQQPLSNVYGSVDVAKNPSLAFRAQPWSERVSHSHRISHCVDSSERFYDTCLPSLRTCFEADGASVWTFSDDPKLMFSPYANVEHGNVGYMIFNDVEKVRHGYDNDPLVNNTWTWSYPYEGKYEPTKRFMKTNEAMGIDTSHTTATSSLLTISELKLPKKIDRFFPLLPGHLDEKELGKNGRNGLRPLLGGKVTSLFPSGSAVDSLYGLSYLIPADVRLNNMVSHTYLSAYSSITVPADAALTGTMSYNDTVKFLFGFGDINNLAYSSYTLDETKLRTMYAQGFETTHLAKASSFGSTSSVSGTIDWSHSVDTHGWLAIKTSGSSTGSIGRSTTSKVNYVSSSFNLPRKGVNWLSSSSPSNEFVLASSTARGSADYAANGNNAYDYLPENAVSTAIVDITSSNPWKFSYDRAVHADPSDKLVTYFAGFPGTPSSLYPVVIFDTVVGKSPPYVPGVTINTGNDVVSMETYSHPETMSPGEYRINFSYVKTSHGAKSTGIIDRAFIDNVKVEIFDLIGDATVAIPDVTSTRLGGNNYPQFQTKIVDNRYNPISGTLTNAQVSGSATTYSSYNFGISPMIRGWKYGLFSGLSANSKATFRRDRFGQLRDMLEQRQYSKFIHDDEFMFSNPATNTVGSGSPNARKPNKGIPGPSPVEVNFVKQSYVADEKGVGRIVFEKVEPSTTYSHNFSTEATSSIPYIEGTSGRTELSYSDVFPAVFYAVDFDKNGNFKLK